MTHHLDGLRFDGCMFTPKQAVTDNAASLQKEAPPSGCTFSDSILVLSRKHDAGCNPPENEARVVGYPSDINLQRRHLVTGNARRFAARRLPAGL